MALSFLRVLVACLSLYVLSLPVAARLSRQNIVPASYLQHKRIANRTTWEDDDVVLEKRDGTKYVFMHHIVGNTFPYTQSDWADDLQRIQAKGIDALALNIGSDDWQRTQVASAYAAAQALGTNFKLFYSFDFTAMGCDVNDIVARVNLYAHHPNQFLVNGRPMISSYSGDCLGNSGWQSVKSQTNGYLMPFIWGLEGNFNNWPSLDSWYCWGCAWPQGNYDKNTDDDQYYISQLGSRYATTISGWFYTHYNYKNEVLRSDDWLINSRWEQLMSMRSQLTFVEMVTWNDYGESDYFGPIKGAEPSGTTWADKFPHTAWFDMSAYYITAFKTGSYPPITEDVIYFWARPHPAAALASGDGLGPPSGNTWTQDYLWAAVFATSPASVTLISGSQSQTFSVGAGVSKLKLPLSPGSVTVRMARSGATIINNTPSDFQFITNPVLYNYNAYVGAATATVPSTPTSASSVSSTSSTTSTTPSSTPSSGDWSYVGCYYDTTGSRVLPNQASSSSSQSVGSCLSSCAAAGFAYGGTEYGIECWCGGSITSGASPAPAADCSQPCAGKSSDVCGNGNRLSLYHQTPPTSTITTISTPPASPSSTPSSTYVGCYYDPNTSRVLSTQISSSSSQTVATCLASCSAAGYVYGGTEYGIECWCANSITSGSSPAPASDCSQPCAGKASDVCGAGNRISVYSISAGSGTTTTTTSVVSSPTPGAWSYVACYYDPSDARVLPNQASSTQSQTTNNCLASCAAAGFAYGGTEYGIECWCGSAITGGSTVAPAGDCSQPCAGNAGDVCGNGNRLSVYHHG